MLTESEDQLLMTPLLQKPKNKNMGGWILKIHIMFYGENS
jgi:hypothetical protein